MIGMWVSGKDVGVIVVRRLITGGSFGRRGRRCTDGEASSSKPSEPAKGS